MTAKPPGSQYRFLLVVKVNLNPTTKISLKRLASFLKKSFKPFSLCSFGDRAAFILLYNMYSLYLKKKIIPDTLPWRSLFLLIWGESCLWVVLQDCHSVKCDPDEDYKWPCWYTVYRYDPLISLSGSLSKAMKFRWSMSKCMYRIQEAAKRSRRSAALRCRKKKRKKAWD